MAKLLFAAALTVVLSVPGRALPAPVPAEADEFPGWKPLGEPEDPLAALDRDGEHLRDAFAAPPSAMWLQNDLRSPRMLDRLAAVRAAARPRGVAALPALYAVLKNREEDAEVRAAAALALGRIRDRSAARALAAALADPDARVRAGAAIALGRLRGAASSDPLARALLTDAAWSVRYAAAVALARDSSADIALSAALASDSAWQVRQQAARSLQFCPGAVARAALTRALGDPEPVVRAAAASALGEIAGVSERQRLAAALRAEPDSAARLVMADAERRALARP